MGLLPDDVDVSVVLPGAGSGLRFHTPTTTTTPSLPKQYEVVCGRPLFLHTLSSFLATPHVRHLVLVVSGDRLQYARHLIDTHRTSLLHPAPDNNCTIQVVAGDSCRHGSIRCGLQHVGDSPLVVIHDAVRPLFDVQRDFLPVCAAALTCGAAGVVRPLVSTVMARGEGGMMGEVLDRSRYVASEMPQAFKRDVIVAAYDRCSREDLETGTECLALAQKYCNVTPKLIVGSEQLFKVTLKRDLILAEEMINSKAKQ